MTIGRTAMAPKFPSPKNVLRIAISVCLVGAFLCALASWPKPELPKQSEGWLRELSSMLFSAMFAFLLLYAEHAGTERVMKRELNRRLSYIESLGCVAIVLAGSISLLYAAITGRVPLLPRVVHANLLLILCVYGEAAFIATVAWSYLNPESERSPSREHRVITSARSPLAADREAEYWSNFVRWPQSAARAFVIAATVFGVVGFTLVVTRPDWELPVAYYDRIAVVPAGLLFTVAAVPFVLFAGLYRIAETRYAAVFHATSTQLHMVCALLTTLEILRVYTVWAFSNSGSAPAPLTFDDLNGVLAFMFLTAVVFVWALAHSSERADTAKAKIERSW